MGNTFDLETKIARAVYALIVGNGCGDPTNVYPGAATRVDIVRTLPNTEIEAGEGQEEDFMGNFRFRMGKIIMRDKAVLESGQKDGQGPFAAAQDRTSQIVGLLVQSDDQTTMDYTRRLLNAYGRAMAVDASNGANAAQAQQAKDNPDMADFSLIYWRVTDYGSVRHVKEDGTNPFFERVVGFECLACNSNVD